MRGRGLGKERGGPVAVDHSLTFCCVKTLSNAHTPYRMCFFKMYKFQSTMDRIVYEFFWGGWVGTQFFSFSFRFRIQGTLTTDP